MTKEEQHIEPHLLEPDLHEGLVQTSVVEAQSLVAILYQIVHTCLIIAITLFKRVVLYVVVVVVLFYNAVDFFYPFPFPLVKLCSCCVASGIGGAWAQ